MSRLIESIRLQNGQYFNLAYHQQRIDYSLKELFGPGTQLNLIELLKSYGPPKEGLYKCRIVYDNVTSNVEFTSYAFRPINTLRLVTNNNIDYSLKFEDRSAIDELFELRNGCDDVLMVKNGFVTDTSAANILFRKEGRWFTPRSCLLKGTVRQKFLDAGKAIEVEIGPADLNSFETFKLINAMLQIDSPEVSIKNISF